MYETFYGLREKPFSMLPDPAFLYLSKQHQMAMTMLEYSLENQASFCVITGDAGTGKTTLVRHLLAGIGDEVSVGLVNTYPGSGELLRWVASAFNVRTKDKTPAQLHRVLADYFIAQYAKNRRTVLIIDEAQSLSVGALEELRLMSNINSEKDLLLQVVLVGQPGLRAILRRLDMEQFAQRVGADSHLEPMRPLETRGYIRHRLMRAGGEREIFSDDACEAVHRHSGGIPRLINLLCDFSLVYAYAGREAMVTEELVDQVVRERAQHNLLSVFCETSNVKQVSTAGSAGRATPRETPEGVSLDFTRVADMTTMARRGFSAAGDGSESTELLGVPAFDPVRTMPALETILSPAADVPAPRTPPMAQKETMPVLRGATMASATLSSTLDVIEEMERPVATRDGGAMTRVADIVREEINQILSASVSPPAPGKKGGIAPPLSQTRMAEPQNHPGGIAGGGEKPACPPPVSPPQTPAPLDLGIVYDPEPKPMATRFFLLGSAVTLVMLLIGTGVGFLLSEFRKNDSTRQTILSTPTPSLSPVRSAPAASPVVMPADKPAQPIPAPIAVTPAVGARDDGLNKLRLEILQYQRDASAAMAKVLERQEDAPLDPAQARARRLAVEQAHALAQEREQAYQALLTALNARNP